MSLTADEHLELLDQARAYSEQYIRALDDRPVIAAFHATAAYFQWSSHRDPMKYTPSMSQRARAIELWAILKTLGRSGVARLVEQLCANAQYFAQRLADEGFQIHNDVVFNQVLASGTDDQETGATLEGVQASGECWCGGSKWQGRAVIRVSVCSWATTREDIDRSVAAFVAARSVAQRLGPGSADTA